MFTKKELKEIIKKRKFVSALVVPEFRLVEDWAREHHIPFSGREELCANEKVQKMLMKMTMMN